MRHFIFSLVIFGLCLSCSQQTELVETEDEFGNVIKYTRNKKDYAKEGAFLLTTPGGVILEEANYIRDTLNGLRIMFYETGDTAVIEHYEMGKFVGPYKSFYVGGQLELEGSYIGNAMTGAWTRYYESGKLMEVVNFKDSEENGPFIEYYENGELKAEGSYLNGDNEHGELKLYDEQGSLVRKMNCKMGICRTTWEAESTAEENI